MKKEIHEADGHFRLVQLGRINTTSDFERKYGIFRGYPRTYKEGKKAFDSIPSEKKTFPFFCASRIFLMFPSDATKEEILNGVEFILSDLKRKWKKEDPKEE